MSLEDPQMTDGRGKDFLVGGGVREGDTTRNKEERESNNGNMMLSCVVGLLVMHRVSAFFIYLW